MGLELDTLEGMRFFAKYQTWNQGSNSIIGALRAEHRDSSASLGMTLGESEAFTRSVGGSSRNAGSSTSLGRTLGRDWASGEASGVVRAERGVPRLRSEGALGEIEPLLCVCGRSRQFMMAVYERVCRSGCDPCGKRANRRCRRENATLSSGAGEASAGEAALSLSSMFTSRRRANNRSAASSCAGPTTWSPSSHPRRAQGCHHLFQREPRSRRSVRRTSAGHEGRDCDAVERTRGGRRLPRER